MYTFYADIVSNFVHIYIPRLYISLCMIFDSSSNLILKDFWLSDILGMVKNPGGEGLNTEIG